MISFLLVPIYTDVMAPGKYGEVTLIFSWFAIFNVFLAYGMETAKSALSVDDLVRYNCGRSWFGGQVVEQENGSSFCAFWLTRPDQ